MINENVNSIPECLDSKNSNSLEINLDKKEPLNKDEEVSSTKSSDELKSEKSFNENNSNIAVVDDEVDAALAVQGHLLRTVHRHLGEAQLLEHFFQHARRRRRELDELEAHQAHGVLKQVCHFSFE